MTKFKVGDVVINIYNPSNIGTISSFSSTTYSMLLFTGGYFTFPISLESMYRLATHDEIPGSTPPVTCTGGSPHYGNGGALLNLYDSNNDGIISMVESQQAVHDQIYGDLTTEEMEFVVSAWKAGSINAKCPGCYTPPDPCAGVTCPNGCWGTSLYSKKCVDGRCVKGALIKSNAPECGYVAPSPPKAIIEYSYTRPTSAKPLDRLLGYVKVKNIGGQASSLGDFTVKWLNADTDAQFAITQQLGVIAPGSSVGNNINITMPDIARPLRVLAKVYYKGTLHDSKEVTVAYTAPPAPVTPAKGKLLNVVLPTSKIHGSTAKIPATIKNIGGTTRKFKITLYRVAAPGVYITQTPVYTIGPGESVNTEISWAAPTSGTSVRYSLKCVNVDDFSLDDYRNFDVALTAPFVCAEGAMRSPETCWDDTTIHGEVCRDNTWVPSGETCPPKPECTEGDKKPGHVCSGGKWVPIGTPPPECTEGDKKPGYVCSGGKWISTMPGPVHGEPSTIEAPEIIPGIKPPRIPLLTPELAKIPLLPGWVIRDADGRIVAGRAPDTIEFQEIVPGIKPPRVPQLIPSLEKLPLLPGWTIRNREGTVVAHGAPLPTIGTEEP